jgi:hypothetical protein
MRSSEGERSASGRARKDDVYGSELLGIGLMVAGLLAFLYAAIRVRPGLSLSLQRRALSFLALAGLFLAAAQAPRAVPAG